MKSKFQAGRWAPAMAIAAATLLAAFSAQAADIRVGSLASNQAPQSEADYSRGPGPRAYRGVGATPVNLLSLLNAARSQPVRAAARRQQVAAAPSESQVSFADVVAEAQWRQAAAERMWRRGD